MPESAGVDRRTAEAVPAGRTPRLRRFGAGLVVSLVWYAVLVAGLALYAASLSDLAPPVDDCSNPFVCGSPRDEMLTFALFVLVPMAALGFGVTLLVLGLLVSRFRSAVWLGTVAAIGGLALGATGFVLL